MKQITGLLLLLVPFAVIAQDGHNYSSTNLPPVAQAAFKGDIFNVLLTDDGVAKNAVSIL